MTKTRDELSAVAMTILKTLEQLKLQSGFAHEDMIFAIAAAMASLPEADREGFRAAFDQIEEEMHGEGSKAPRLS